MKTERNTKIRLFPANESGSYSATAKRARLFYNSRVAAARCGANVRTRCSFLFFFVRANTTMSESYTIPSWQLSISCLNNAVAHGPAMFLFRFPRLIVCAYANACEYILRSFVSARFLRSANAVWRQRLHYRTISEYSIRTIINRVVHSNLALPVQKTFSHTRACVCVSL